MPSKLIIHQETCYPCKYHNTELYRSGRDPIYNRFCTHPQALQPALKHLPQAEAGRFIGTSDNRPQWCPIRGDVKAEAEAADNE